MIEKELVYQVKDYRDYIFISPHKDPFTMVETIKELSEIRTDFTFAFWRWCIKTELTEQITNIN